MARAKKAYSSNAKSRPLRRSQLISPFGVGAITDFRGDESLMCAGLDCWFPSEADIPAHLRLEEPRLQRRLGRAFFVRPPEHKGEDNQRRRVPYVRFPQWHYCPRCFQMTKATYFQDQPVCSTCSDKHRRRMIPVRIVAACERGHIQDFPFRLWIKCACEDDAAARLRFKAGRSSSGLAGISISCDRCAKKRSLSGAMQPQNLEACGATCSGSRPWLAEETSPCDRQLKGIQKGGSNVYFPVITSSIFVPEEQGGSDDRIFAILNDDRLWTILSSSVEDGKLDLGRIELLAEAKSVDAERLMLLAQRKLDGEPERLPASEEEFRQQEFVLLRRSQTDPNARLVSDWVPGSEYGDFGRYIEGVGLVRRLQETRVLCGFSRLEPQADPGDDHVQKLARSEKLRWLPALDTYGEGIFVELKNELLEQWSIRRVVEARLQRPLEAFESVRKGRGQAKLGVHPKLVLLHTFAHALIKELTFSCGYGTSSLRERLYVDVERPDVPMSGVLIYTAAGDADGTLGGLVEQGQPMRLQRMVSEALRRASWCSNDPVCIESTGRTPDTANLAACHSCSLVPETSCEHGNRLLDRATLVGTIADREVGFLSNLLSANLS